MNKNHRLCRQRSCILLDILSCVLGTPYLVVAIVRRSREPWLTNSSIVPSTTSRYNLQIDHRPGRGQSLTNARTLDTSVPHTQGAAQQDPSRYPSYKLS